MVHCCLGRSRLVCAAMTSSARDLSYFLDYLHDIFIIEYMIFTDPLRLMLHRRTPHPGVLELIHDASMDTITELFHTWTVQVQNDRRRIIRNLTLGLRVTVGMQQHGRNAPSIHWREVVRRFYRHEKEKQHGTYIRSMLHSSQIISSSSSMFHPW